MERGGEPGEKEKEIKVEGKEEGKNREEKVQKGNRVTGNTRYRNE